MRAKSLMFYIVFSFVIMACVNEREGNEFDLSVDNKSAYEKVYDYICKKQIAEGLLYLDSLQDDDMDRFILRAYLNLYISDSTQICTMLDSAWVGKFRNQKNPSLAYKRYIMSAKILSSDNVCDFSRAQTFTDLAIDVYKKDSTVGDFCEIQNLQGLIFSKTGKIMQSVKSYKNSLKHVSIKYNKTAEVQAYLGLAYIFHKWSRRSMELEYARKAMDAVSKMDKLDVYTFCNTLQIAGNAFENNNISDSALFYYKQAYQTSVLSGMTYYTEIFNKDVLRLQEIKSGKTIPKNNLYSVNLVNELQNTIKTSTQELKELNDKLKSDLYFEINRSKILIFICCLLSVLIFCIIVYLWRYHQNNKRKLSESESRMREFEIALDAQHITLLLAERNTEQFMQQFCTMYPNFITRLQEINSNITKNDLVICALIALGEDCASIQKIRHISKESLWAARYRIRTKLKLTHDEKLEDFIRSVIQ